MAFELFHRLEQLYADMEREYDHVAGQVGLACSGCPDNCCTSYFQHHTHVEWAYLWVGLQGLPGQQLKDVRTRAENYVRAAHALTALRRVPDLMCPLNEQGLCALYSFRLMICRLHGVPNSFTLPNGQSRSFPGCFRCREVLDGRHSPPEIDRTGFYTRLASLEVDFLKNMPVRPAKVRLTLAEMIHLGPPAMSPLEVGA